MCNWIVLEVVTLIAPSARNSVIPNLDAPTEDSEGSDKRNADSRDSKDSVSRDSADIQSLGAYRFADEWDEMFELCTISKMMSDF